MNVELVRMKENMYGADEADMLFVTCAVTTVWTPDFIGAYYQEYVVSHTGETEQTFTQKFRTEEAAIAFFNMRTGEENL